MEIGRRSRAAGAILAPICIGVLLAAAGAAASAPGFTLLDETADESFNVTFALTTPQPWRGGAEADFAFNILDDAHHYIARFRDGQAGLLRVNGGKPTAIGVGGPIPEADGPLDVTLQRRGARMAILCGGVRVASAGDGEYRGGRLGSRSTREGLGIDDVAYQVVVPPHMDDDFMREGDAGGTWETVSGTWENAGPTGPRPTPEESANPFSYRCSAPGGYGLATAGNWFWDSYEVRAAMRPLDDGAVGLCAYYQDPKNYYLFRWVGLGDGQGRRQILRVRDGQGVPLAQSEGGYEIGQWYVVALRAFDGHLQALIDGEVVLEAHDDTFGEGQVGLYVVGCSDAYFDDVRVQSFEGLADDFEAAASGRWRDIAGNWKLDQGHFYGQPGAVRGSGKMAAAVSSYGEWSDCSFDALVKPKTAAAVGLRFRCRDDANYHVFRWTGGADGEQQLLRVREGKPTLLASRPRTYQSDRMYRLSVKVDGGYILACVDGDPALEAVDTETHAGGVGLQAEGGGPACFDNVAVLPLIHEEHTERIQPQFVRENSMDMWTKATSEWRRADDAYWYQTALFADHSISLRLPSLRGRDGSLEVFLGADGEHRDSGALLTLQKEGIAPRIEARLQYAGQVMQTATIEGADAEQTVELRREGSWVVASIEGRPLVSYQTAGPMAGYYAGFRSDGFGVSVGEGHVTSPNMVDYTFARAPTDWRPQQGVWEVADRWTCTPGWAWFRGSGHRSPIIWSKARFRGNMELRFWGAFQHPYPDEGPSNLNATICGDGANLCSGYNFIFAGDKNAGSRILRGNDEVTKNTSIRRGDKDSYHRHWFDVQIRKIGGKITYHVDGMLVGQYDDSEPFDAGRIAFWSYDGNGVLIARARLSYEARAE